MFVESGFLPVAKARAAYLVDLESDKVVDAVIDGVLWRNNGSAVLSKEKGVLEGHESLDFCDLNNDGSIDVIAGGKLTIYWNDGRGHFRPQEVQVESSIGGISAVVDMDQDGLRDVVSMGRNEVYVVFNAGGRFDKSRKLEVVIDSQFLTDGFYEQAMPYSPNKREVQPSELAFGGQTILTDLDGDDDADLVTVRYGWDCSLPDYVWQNEGGGRFRLTQILEASGNWFSEAAQADFDRDGDIDLLVGGDHGSNLLWINDGKGRFHNSGLVLSGGVHAVAVGDLDGDGDIDVFTVGCTPPTLLINECSAKADSETETDGMTKIPDSESAGPHQ